MVIIIIKEESYWFVNFNFLHIFIANTIIAITTIIIIATTKENYS